MSALPESLQDKLIYVHDVDKIVSNLKKADIRVRFNYMMLEACNDWDFNYTENKEKAMDYIEAKGYDAWYWDSLERN